MDSSAAHGLDLLPPEILCQIFGLLHIVDRRNVRLVCREWYAQCGCTAIVKNEKFSFRDGYSIKEINVFLRNCNRVRDTIEFRGLSLKEFPSKRAWRRIGKRIRSLSFVNCEMSSETTKNIFLFCEDMHAYKLVNVYSSFPIDRLFCSLDTLDELIQLDIRHEKMMSFQLYLGVFWLKKDFFRRISKIFPRIRAYGTGYPIGYQFDEEDMCGGMGSLLNTFDSAMIKELTINIANSDQCLENFADVSQLKLQILRTAIGNDYRKPTVKFMDFLRNQSELRTLEISMLNNKLDYGKMILFESFSNHPNLVNFCLYDYSCLLYLTARELLQVLRMVSSSKLECFKTQFCFDDEALIDPEFVDSLAPLANKTLQVLHLDTQYGYEKIPEDYLSAILIHFCGLRNLRLTAPSNKVLQTIFQYHIKLHALILDEVCFCCTTFGFTGREISSSNPGFPISRLSELSHLEIRGSLSDESLREFNFPRLKCLILGLHRQRKEISIDSLSTALPLLERLELDGVYVPRNSLLAICKQLRRLKVLFYSWSNASDSVFFNNHQRLIARPSTTFAANNGLKYYYKSTHPPILESQGIIGENDLSESLLYNSA